MYVSVPADQSSPVNMSTIKSEVLTLFSLDRRVFGQSVTSIANPNSLGDAIAFSVKQWQTAYV